MYALCQELNRASNAFRNGQQLASEVKRKFNEQKDKLKDSFDGTFSSMLQEVFYELDDF